MRFEKQIMFYLLGLVCFSSGITNQSLAIPIISICVLGGFFRHIYFAVIGFFLILNSAGLNLGYLYKDNVMIHLFDKSGFVIACWIIFIILFYRLVNPLQYSDSQQIDYSNDR